MPGMIDGHAHPIEGGLTLVQTRYSALDGSVPNLVRFVESKLDDPKAHRGDVLIIYDLDLGIWSHSAEIDAALSSGKFAKQRIVFYGSDGHTAWANRPARLKAGVTQAFLKRLPAGERVYYGFDAQFNPNGFLVDAAQSRVSESLPPITPKSPWPPDEPALEYMHSLRHHRLARCRAGGRGRRIGAAQRQGSRGAAGIPNPRPARRAHGACKGVSRGAAGPWVPADRCGAGPAGAIS